MKENEFLNCIYQMREAQKDCNQNRSNYAARNKARMYEAKVDAEIKRRLNEL